MKGDIDIGYGDITLSRRPVNGKLYFMASDPAYSEEVSLEDAKEIVQALVKVYGPEILDGVR